MIRPFIIDASCIHVYIQTDMHTYLLVHVNIYWGRQTDRLTDICTHICMFFDSHLHIHTEWMLPHFPDKKRVKYELRLWLEGDRWRKASVYATGRKLQVQSPLSARRGQVLISSRQVLSTGLAIAWPVLLVSTNSTALCRCCYADQEELIKRVDTVDPGECSMTTLYQ